MLPVLAMCIAEIIDPSLGLPPLTDRFRLPEQTYAQELRNHIGRRIEHLQMELHWTWNPQRICDRIDALRKVDRVYYLTVIVNQSVWQHDDWKWNLQDRYRLDEIRRIVGDENYRNGVWPLP